MGSALPLKSDVFDGWLRALLAALAVSNRALPPGSWLLFHTRARNDVVFVLEMP
jgi:hypothetical protein